MKNKTLIILALLFAGSVLSFLLINKTESIGIVPIDSVFEVTYNSSTKGAGFNDEQIAGYLNYKGTLKIEVKSQDESGYRMAARLTIKDIESEPSIAGQNQEIYFAYRQENDGLIKDIDLPKDLGNESYSMVLNLLANMSHKLFGFTDKPVHQEFFTGRTISKYSEISLPSLNRKVSFKYLSTKQVKVTGGGYVVIKDSFYESIENKYRQTKKLYDKREQISDVEFRMIRKNDTEELNRLIVNKKDMVKDSLSGLNLKERFKLEEMKNLIWLKEKDIIRDRFFSKDSDGQPWYEYMAYYYVNKDKRHELNEDFDKHPEKRGDIVLVMTSIGDELAQKQFVELLNNQNPEDQNNYFRYGIFVDNPNNDLIEAYKGYSSQQGTEAATAEKILASLYHKHLNNGQYDSDVESLIESLEGDTVADQRHRFSVLGNLGYPQVSDNLENDLNNKDEDIERLAIDALRFNEDNSSHDILIEKAESNNSAVRLSALESLRGDYINDAYNFYERRMEHEGNKDNRLQLLKNIFELRNTDARYVDLVSDEVKNCAYQEICSAAQKMLDEM